MRWKSHVRFGGRAGETDSPRGGHRAPVRSHLGNRAVDEVRRRIQNELTGHRRRKGDPLYDIRKILLTGAERLGERGWAHLHDALRRGDPHDEVLATWLGKEHLRESMPWRTPPTPLVCSMR